MGSVSKFHKFQTFSIILRLEIQHFL